MTDFYCDHGVYSSALGTVPSWGIPQEGDGTSLDAAGASSVVSVDLTSITSTAGTLSLFGSAAVSVGASASGATLATQIAAAINGSSVTTGNTTIFPGSPQLRNAFYATTTGATLNIMCRIGSALTNVLGLVWGGTWSAGPPSNLTFAGGTGGCWGWFINNAAIGVSGSIAALTYGGWVHMPYCGTKPTMADTVWIRTGGGASKEITITWSADTLVARPDNYPSNVIFDTNTKWTGDSPTGKVKLLCSTGSAWVSLKFRMGCGNGISSYVALRPGGFELEFASSAGYANLRFAVSANGGWQNVRFAGHKFVDSAPNNDFYPFGRIDDYSGISYFTFEDCEYSVTTPRATVRQLFTLSLGYASASHLLIVGGKMDYNINTPADPGAIASAGNDRTSSLRFVGTAFLGYTSGFRLAAGLGSMQSANPLFQQKIIADNCSGLRLPDTYLGLPSYANGTDNQPSQDCRIIAQTSESSGTGQGMRIEDYYGIVEWLPGAAVAFPTLSAINTTTGLAWSLRLVWLSALQHNPGKPYCAPDLRMLINAGDGVKTFTLELFAPSTVTAGVEASFTYTGVDGLSHVESARSLVASGTTWTNAGLYSGFTAKKLTVTSSVSVKGSTPVTCSVRLVATAPASVTYVYYDPEFSVA